MTLRSIIVGLLGGVAICSFSFFNDRVINQQMLVLHQMPPVVYAALVFGVLVTALACRHSRKRWAFSGSEWAVVVGLWLVACGIPGWGLVECVPPTAIMTHHYARLEPGWRSGGTDVVATVPERMLVDIESADGTVLDGYVAGLGEGLVHIPVSAVPWSNWGGTMWFWFPFIVSFSIAVLGLAAVVHRQWSQHECLPYPISAFAHALLPGEDGKVPILRERLFWLGAVPVLVLYLNNYLVRWFPEALIPVHLSVDLSPLYEVLPFLKGPGFHYRLSFAVLGLAYFLRTNVAFSVGIVPYIHMSVVTILMAYGVTLSGGDHVGGNYNTFLFAGGYAGIFLLMLYTGRFYYRNALQRGLFFPAAGEDAPASTVRLRAACVGGAVFALLLLVVRAGWLPAVCGGGAVGLLHAWAAPKFRVRDPVDEQALWGIRVFLVGLSVFLGILVWVGLDWQLAVLFAAIAVVTVLVVSRAVAETGAFHFGTFFLPGPLILGAVGAAAVGPRPMLIMALAGSAILLAPGWTPMAFMVQALKIADLAKADVHRTARLGIAVLLLCVPIALAVTIYWSYDAGAPVHAWPHVANRYCGRDMVRLCNRLEAQGTLEATQSLSGWERFRHVSPTWPHVAAFAIIASLTILCGWCGLRFTKWPFHPVMFLFLGSFHGQHISVSLLFGCALKWGVTRYGGAACYERLKPMMVGFIAGSVVAAAIPFVVGMIYYLVTGLPPQPMHGIL